MVSFALRRLYVSSQNWLQPATRFSIIRTRHATPQWRVLASAKNFSSMDEYEAAMQPTPGAPPAPTRMAPAKLAPVKMEPMKLEASSPLPDALGLDGTTDWSKSYSGLSTQPFSREIAEVLMAPLNPMDVEVKPGKHFSQKKKVLESSCSL
jgi:hypothetical protein